MIGAIMCKVTTLIPTYSGMKSNWKEAISYGDRNQTKRRIGGQAYCPL